MASRDFNPKTGKARVFFRYGGRQFNKTIRVRDDNEARRVCALVEETIQDLERGKLTLPPDAEPAAFILSGGKVTSKPKPEPAHEAPKPLTLGEVFETYSATLTPGSKGTNTISTENVHAKHFRRIIGEKSILDALGVDALQRYVDARAREGVGRETIHKELSTLRVVWAWALKRRHVTAPLAWKMADLTLPKADEKPPFQTWDQIARKIKRGGLSDDEQAELWECLWLDQEQTLECLAWVEEHGCYPFIHPLFAFAAYTGARRSEMLCSERDDWDFEAGVVSIRQKKANKSRTFTRRNVTIHPALADVMRRWFKHHPGGPWTIATADGARIVPMSATKYFRRTVRGGKWSVLRGWHVFRHSLASNMASAGVDQRVINEMLGHHTDEMERRYRHLLPRTQAQALHGLFQAAS
jgi:site-specific recombinase XerD